VITAVDGQALRGDSALARVTYRHKPGDKITLTVQRQSQSMQIPVTLGTLPS
jgi:S1-C subfamily serine protease